MSITNVRRKHQIRSGQLKLTRCDLLRPCLAHVRATRTLTLRASVSVLLVHEDGAADRFDGAEELLVTAVATLLALVKEQVTRIREVPFVAVVAQRPELEMSR
jgi:hypothetical protein